MSINPDKLKKVIDGNRDKKQIARRIIEKNPETLPVISKLKKDEFGSGEHDIENRLSSNAGVLLELHNKMRNVKENNRAIIELFPDIEMSIQIIVSSILSPKKMTETDLLYSINKNKNVPPSVTTPLLGMLKDYMNDEYEFEDKLPLWIRESLFESGSYVQLVVPEASLDNIVNRDLLTNYSTEDYKAKVDQIVLSSVEPINLKTLPIVTTEKIDNDAEELAKYLSSRSMVNLTDNPGILKYSEFKNSMRSSIVKRSMKGGISVSLESAEKLSYLDLFRSDRGSRGSNHNYEYIKTKSQASRKSLGKPMVVKIPSESIIPVFLPGATSNHISYLILLDESGRPLNVDNRANSIEDINNGLVVNPNNKQTPIQKAYRNLIMNSTSNVDMRGLFEVYKSVMEKQIYETINESIYNSDVEIANQNDVFFLMFVRALSGRRTNILLAPRELVSYGAFQYNELGIGKSLLENLAILSSLRAILLFSKVMGQVKQSIDITKVNVSLDPNDPDPEKTIEQIQDGVLKLRQNFMPLGINNPVDLVNWLQKAGLQFEYTNNPRIPDVQLAFENNNMQHTMPDSDLDEDLRRQMILSLGLSPETVDDSFSPEFATTVVSNNLLLSKRIAIYQNKLCSDLKEFLELIIYNDEDLRTEIKEILNDNMELIEASLDEEEKALMLKDKERFLEYYIEELSNALVLSLPKPEHSTLENMAVEFSQYVENLDNVLDNVISTEFFTDEITGEISMYIDSLKAIYKGHLVRKWMAENNYYTETLDISLNDEEDIEHLLEVITTYMSTTMKNSTKLMSIMKRFKKAVNVDLMKIMTDDEEGEDSFSGDTDSDDTTDDEGEGDMDDFDDLGF